MYRARDYWGRVRGGDPLTQMIAIAALILLVVVALPYLPVQVATNGVACLNLPSPKNSGSNQSLLASQIDPSVLRLELKPDAVAINQGAPLSLDLRFINDSMAPLTLMIIPEEIIYRYTGREDGIAFSIQSTSGQVLGESPNTRPPFPAHQQFTQNQLRVLGPRQRCSLRVDIDPARLNAAQVTRGEYQFTAVYRNQSKGALPPPAALTPTPIFRDQGVWIGQVQSNTIRVSVGLPTQAPSQ